MQVLINCVLSHICDTNPSVERNWKISFKVYSQFKWWRKDV